MDDVLSKDNRCLNFSMALQEGVEVPRLKDLKSNSFPNNHYSNSFPNNHCSKSFPSNNCSKDDNTHVRFSCCIEQLLLHTARRENPLKYVLFFSVGSYFGNLPVGSVQGTYITSRFTNFLYVRNCLY